MPETLSHRADAADATTSGVDVFRRERREKTGYDIAYVSVVVIGCFLVAIIIILGFDLALNRGTQLSDNSQIVIVSALGTIGSIAGGALGYWVGGTTERRKNGVDDDVPPIDETPTGGDPSTNGA